MVKVRRSWTEFKALAEEKGLILFFGDNNLNTYDLLAIDGSVCYQCLIHKAGGSDQIEFEASYLPTISNHINQQPIWDEIVASCPSSTTTLHTYYKNGLVVQTVLVTYSSAAKKDIVRIQRSLS